MKTHGGWHIIQTWVFREEDSEKVISNLRLTGQAENNHKRCEILKEEGRCKSGVLGRGIVHRHRERREHDTSWATNSKCWSTECLHVIRGLSRKGLGGLLINLTFILRTLDTLKGRNFKQDGKRISLPFSMITKEGSRLESGKKTFAVIWARNDGGLSSFRRNNEQDLVINWVLWKFGVLI